MIMTKAMKRAVEWLSEHNGSGVIDNHGHVLAGGEVATHIAAETWLRLIAWGYLQGHGGRIALGEGRAA